MTQRNAGFMAFVFKRNGEVVRRYPFLIAQKTDEAAAASKAMRRFYDECGPLLVQGQTVISIDYTRLESDRPEQAQARRVISVQFR